MKDETKKPNPNDRLIVDTNKPPSDFKTIQVVNPDLAIIKCPHCEVLMMEGCIHRCNKPYSIDKHL